MSTKRKRKSTKKTNKTTKKNKKYVLNFVGLVLVFISLFAGCKLGLAGRFLANVYRVFVGDSYLIVTLLLALLGIFLFLFGRVPHIGWKRTLGLAFLIIGSLTIMHGMLFQQLNLKNDLIGVTWRLLMNEMHNNQVANSVGGGLIGAFCLVWERPLLSIQGTYLINGLITLSGFLMLCQVQWQQVVNFCRTLVSWLVRLLHLLHWPKFKKRRPSQRAKSLVAKQPKISPVKSDSVTADDDFTIEGPQPPVKSSAKPPKSSTPLSSLTSSEKAPITAKTSSDQEYQLPTVDLLTNVPPADQSQEYELIDYNRKKLKQTFDSFGVQVDVKKATLGPTVTKYEIQPAIGVKVSRIVNLADDLALALAAKDIRIEAPIPGKPYVGIEVPNQHASIVSFREVIEHEPAHPGEILTVPLGKDVYGQIAMCNLVKMPHLLIAGSTGSGKSVAINTIITGILMQARPSEVKMILIDPKMVELSVYNGIPHLLIPVVTDVKKATGALQKAVDEMERRYRLFEKTGHRKIEEYNTAVDQNNQDPDNPPMDRLPYIVVIVDELSDLMMAAGKDVETSIVRLSQKARAAGMHLIIATQRPSVDVITGLIKANIPSRMAFAVSSNIDSRTILDSTGAEKLLGRGDMLFLPLGASKPQRIQGAYISSQDVEQVVSFVSSQQAAEYDETMIPSDQPDAKQNQDPDDAYWQQAVELVIHEQRASVSMLQRRFAIGYNRAARLIDYMEERGLVGPARGSKPRKVLISRSEDDKQDD